MKTLNDNLFKFTLLFFLVVISIIMYNISLNGRYLNHENGIIDTRTGKIYFLDRNSAGNNLFVPKELSDKVK